MKLLIGITLMLSALPVEAAGARKAAVVILDSWWGADFAKETCDRAKQWQQENASSVQHFGCEAVVSCPEMTARLVACAAGEVEQYREFESGLSTEFAADTSCKGIRFLIFKSPDTANKEIDRAMAHPHWMLGVDFVPGAAKQDWWLNDSDLHTRGSGNGTAETIVRKACNIVNGRGAAVPK